MHFLVLSHPCGVQCRYGLLLRQTARLPTSHGAAAETTFADAIPPRSKSSMVGYIYIYIYIPFFFLTACLLSILHITLSYVVAAFRKTMVDDLVEAADGTNSSWFIDSCFTHCQTIFDSSGWNSAAAPRIGNKVRRRGCMWME